MLTDTLGYSTEQLTKSAGAYLLEEETDLGC